MSDQRPDPTTLELSDEIRAAFPGTPGEVFDRILALEGRVYREIDNRRTLRFEIDGRGYFLKAHLGSTWREVLKNWVRLKRPVLGADVERHAIAKFDDLGIPTTPVVGHGERGHGPTQQQSFLITEELTNTESLEDYCRPWPENPPEPRWKAALIDAVAGTVRTMHGGGVHHRDCYACHFLLDLDTADASSETAPKLFVIDLHRATVSDRLSTRELVKDLGGLLFSALEFGLTREDLRHFANVYQGRSPDDESTPRSVEEAALWDRLRSPADALFRKVHGRAPPEIL